MDHGCHKCGARVEDGVAFCPQCGAPQIRVSALEHTSEPLPSEAPGASALAQPAAPPAGPQASAVPAGPATLQWGQVVPAAASAGVLLALAGAVPFIGFFIWMLAGGVLAVVLYRRRFPTGTLTPRLGAKVGAVAGLFGFGAFTVLMSIQLL